MGLTEDYSSARTRWQEPHKAADNIRLPGAVAWRVATSEPGFKQRLE